MRRAGDQAEAVAVGVELGDVDRRAERVVPRLADADLELAGQILGQLSAGDLEGAVRHLGHGVGEAGVGERAHVVEVEGVAGAELEVPLRPVRGAGEVRRCGEAEPLGGTGDLGAAELHVVLPDRLRVERVGECGDQRLRGSGGGGAGVEPLRLAQQRQRLDRVGLLLGREGERRRDPAGEVRADRLAGGRGVEDRPVRDVPVQRVGVVVVGLGQPPPVVVTDEGALLVARAEADLQVQREGRLVPHLVQPGRGRSAPRRRGSAAPGCRAAARW